MPNILIIGELCRDIYRDAKPERFSPESFVPVLKNPKETETLGMAGNVYNNLISLEPRWTYLFVHQKEEIQKIRYCAGDQQFIRVDYEDEIPEVEIHDIETIMNANNLWWHDLDAVVISSYNKGFVSESIIEEISNICQSPIFLDCKFDLGDWSREIDFVKINEKEYEEQSLANPESFCRNLIVTRGGEGADWYEDGEYKGNHHVDPIEVRSVAGAGDSFLAGLVVGCLNGNVEGAIRFANQVARVAVSRPGVVAVKREWLNGFAN